MLVEPSQNLLPGLDTTVSLLGGSVLPPRHVLPPGPVSHPLPIAAPCFPARPSTPSRHQKSQSSRTGTKAGPVSFLLLLSTYQRGRRRGLCCRPPLYPLSLHLSRDFQPQQTVNTKPQKSQVKSFPETVRAPSGRLLTADLKPLTSPPDTQSEFSYSVKL